MIFLCFYSFIANCFGWSFLGTEISPAVMESRIQMMILCDNKNVKSHSSKHIGSSKWERSHRPISTFFQSLYWWSKGEYYLCLLKKRDNCLNNPLPYVFQSWIRQKTIIKIKLKSNALFQFFLNKYKLKWGRYGVHVWPDSPHKLTFFPQRLCSFP